MKEGEVIGGKYELSRLIATGAMGTVFEAYHVQLRRRIALKFLRQELCDDKEATARFLREAQAAAAIGSEHIAPVTDVGQTDDGLPFLVMEYLEGQTLAQAMRAERRFDVARAASLAIQLCWAVAAAHEKGIIHRDIKPDNVFLVPRADGTELVKVLDFGIAKMLVTMSADQAQLTAQGTTLGTPYYMAPEQARGVSDLDGRVDIYSIGVLLYEMLTGRQPFTGVNFTAIVVAASTTDPIPPRTLRSDLPKELEKVVLRAMAREREQRYAMARDLADALEPFALARSTMSARPEPLGEGSVGERSSTAQGPPTAVMPKLDVKAAGERRTNRLFVFGFIGVLVVAALVGVAFVGGYMLSRREVESAPPPTLPAPMPPPLSSSASSTEPETNKPEGDASAPGQDTPPTPQIVLPELEERPLSQILPEASRHLKRERFRDCLQTLQGVADSPQVSLLRLKCLRGAGHLNEACHVAQTCLDQRFCKSFFEQRCQR